QSPNTAVPNPGPRTGTGPRELRLRCEMYSFQGFYRSSALFCYRFYRLLDDPCYECEDGWKQHGENCYFFSTRKSSWDASRTVCRTQGGDLVKIDSSEDYVIYFWIGLTDSAEEGRWLWVDGSPLNERLTFWFFHEPDDWTEEDSDGEDCARMEPMYWFDKSCKARERSICEKPAAAVCPHFSSGTTVRVEDTMSYFSKANAANI
uniref:C-type lectin domain-containing protein n=1 Tax=Astatotilapia calliptera TaxID=8154 RepID=A0A3P8QR91_ASTCA